MRKSKKKLPKHNGRVKYPNVRCGRPGHRDEPGYVVCVHVKGGAAVAQVIPATRKSLGQILCLVGDHSTKESGELVCAHCARAKGWIA